MPCKANKCKTSPSNAKESKATQSKAMQSNAMQSNSRTLKAKQCKILPVPVLFANDLVIVIDEVSMISADLLGIFEKTVRRVVRSNAPYKSKRVPGETKGTPRAFGGINVILCADFWQLKPVAGTYLQQSCRSRRQCQGGNETILGNGSQHNSTFLAANRSNALQRCVVQRFSFGM